MKKNMDGNENKKVSAKFIDPNRVSKIAYDLVQLSKQQHAKGLDVNEIPEIKTLKKMCGDENLIICETGLTAFLHLVSVEVLSASQAISVLISMLQSASNHPPVVNAIGMLLLLDVRLEGKSITFNLTELQHPLITILKNDREKYWPMIYSCVQYALFGEKSLDLHKTLQMLQPVFRYIFCNPSQQSFNFKNELLSLFLCDQSISSRISIPVNVIQNYVLEAFLWQKINMNYCLMVLKITNYLLLHSNEASLPVLNALVPYLALSVKWLIENGYNPSVWIDQISLCISVSPITSSIILLILSDVASKTSVSNINNIIRLGNQILESGTCNKFSFYAFAAANLKWLMYPTLLRNVNDDHHETQAPLSDKLKVMFGFLHAKNVTWQDESPELFSNNFFDYLKNSQLEVKTHINILKMISGWGNDSEIIEWLRNLPKHEIGVQKKFFWLICGFVLCEKNVELLSLSLGVLENILNFSPDLSYSLCVLLLYKLSREMEPSLQLKYLLMLASLSVDMAEVPIIIRIMDGFTQNVHRIMTPMAMRLYLTLWKNELRIYPYLYKLLTIPCQQISEMSWEINVSKAAAMRDICRFRPNTYGKDLVPLLSGILNTCSYDNSGMASALAIEAITELCKAHVTDIGGTWKALRPKLAKDNRRSVKVSLCKMFGEIPALKSDDDTENEQLIHDAISALWNYIIGDDFEVAKAAMKALGKFPLEDHKLKLMPEAFRNEKLLPKEDLKNSGEIAKKPEDVLPYIPGVCWLEFLKKINPNIMKEAQELIISLIEKELQSLPKGLFYLYPGKAEPHNYANLPQWSIIRSFTDHLRRFSDTNLSNSPSMLIKNILKILSHEFSKLLPPLNWTFLENFLKNNNYSKESLALSAKQAPSSPSAKFLADEYLQNLTLTLENIDEILFLYSILPSLCIAIQPNYLRAFVDRTLRLTLDSALNEQTQHFEIILEKIKLTLLENDILETNRTVLVSLLENLLPSVPTRHRIMKFYSQCAAEFPAKFIEKITCPSNWWQITPVKIEQAIAIRSAIAGKSDSKTPLAWLNECIDVVGSMSEQRIIVLQELLTIIKNRRNEESYCKWMVELMSRTQASVFSESSTSDSIEATLFLVDVFMSCSIVLAGHDCFIKDIYDIINNSNDRISLFPTALQELLNLAKWSEIAPQVIEWLHKLSRWKEMPLLYRKTLEQAVLALREIKYCANDSKWPRLFDFKCGSFV